MSATTRVALSVIVITAMITACDKDQRSYRASNMASARDGYVAAEVISADTASSASFRVVARRMRPIIGEGVGGAAKAALAQVPVAAAAPPNENRDQPENSAIPENVVPGSMLVRVGQASVQVESLETGISRVRDMARRTGAIIANTSMEDGKEQTRSSSAFHPSISTKPSTDSRRSASWNPSTSTCRMSAKSSSMCRRVW
jgi:hypothetical protein